MDDQLKSKLYEDYISGNMSEHGKINYITDVKSGKVSLPQNVSFNNFSSNKPYELPSKVLDDFAEGKLSKQGINNLVEDMRRGKIITGESEDVSLYGKIKEAATGEKRKVESTEKLPSWVKMPEINQLNLRTVKNLVGTMAAGPDEIVSVLTDGGKNKIKVDKDKKGNYILTSSVDGKKYAIKPGFRVGEDLLRGASTMLLYAMGGKAGGTTKLGRVGAAMGTQFGIEATQEMAGGKFDTLEIPLAGLMEGGGALSGDALAAIKGLFKKGTTAAEKAVQMSEKAGVNPMTSDIFPPETFVGKTSQSTKERVPFVGTGGMRKTQQTQRLEAIRNVLKEYGADEAAKASDDVMKDLLKKRGADIRKYTNAKMGVIDRLSKKGTVGIDKTYDTITGVLTDLEKYDNKDTKKLIDVIYEYASDFEGKNLSEIETLRKQLGEKLKDADLATVKDQSQKAYNKIYGSLREDMGDFIKENGESRDFLKWDASNKRLSSMMDELNVTTLKSALKRGKQTPEEVRKLLFSNKESDIRLLYRNLTPEGKTNAKVAIWQEAAEKAGGIENLTTAKFETALKKLEKSTNVFFTKEDGEVLKGLTTALETTRQAEKAALYTPTGMQMGAWSAPAALSWLLRGNPVFGLSATAGIGVIGRAYESRPVRNILVKIAKGKGSEQELIKQLVNTLRTTRALNKRTPQDFKIENDRAYQLATSIPVQ